MFGGLFCRITRGLPPLRQEGKTMTYSIESNFGLYNVCETDGKTRERLIASCRHWKDAERIRALYAGEPLKVAGDDDAVADTWPPPHVSEVGDE